MYTSNSQKWEYSQTGLDHFPWAEQQQQCFTFDMLKWECYCPSVKVDAQVNKYNIQLTAYNTVYKIAFLILETVMSGHAKL